MPQDIRDQGSSRILRIRRMKSRFGVALRDSRGATAAAFGVSAVAAIGMVGLATEAGGWYLTRRDAQNAADPAAYAGAMRLSFARTQLTLSGNAPHDQGVAAAADVATRNGFSTGKANTTVTVSIPPTSGPNAGNNSAVEVIIRRTPPRLVSGLFLRSDPVIRTRAVAALTDNGPGCVLALHSGLTIQGNTFVGQSNCNLASNAINTNAINVNGGPTINTTLVSAGGCNDCGSYRALTYQPPTTDPYTALNNINFSKPTGSQCLAVPKNGGTIGPPAAGQGFCSDVSPSGKNAMLNFKPGTYVFWESSLKVDTGSIVCNDCTPGGAGVTFIFTGSKASSVGQATINTSGTVRLNAPGSGTYAGILIYRDDLGSSSGNPEIQITGGANVSVSGAIYGPTSYVDFNGNSNTNCLIVVANQIRLSGTTNFTSAGCPTAMPIPQTQIVRLME